MTFKVFRDLRPSVQWVFCLVSQCSLLVLRRTRHQPGIIEFCLNKGKGKDSLETTSEESGLTFQARSRYFECWSNIGGGGKRCETNEKYTIFPPSRYITDAVSLTDLAIAVFFFYARVLRLRYGSTTVNLSLRRCRSEGPSPIRTHFRIY